MGVEEQDAPDTVPDGVDPELADESGEQALLSRIPRMDGGNRMATMKADYLSFRATGFPVRQALHLVGVSQATLGRWRKTDPAFADIETNKLPELQSSVGPDLVRLDFMRNMRMAIRGDFKVLFKAVHHLDSLTDREFQYLKRIRGLYTPGDLLTVSKALAPDSDTPTDFAELVMRVSRTRETAEVRIVQEQPAEKPNVFEGEPAKT